MYKTDFCGTGHYNHQKDPDIQWQRQQVIITVLYIQKQGYLEFLMCSKYPCCIIAISVFNFCQWLPGFDTAAYSGIALQTFEIASINILLMV